AVFGQVGPRVGSVDPGWGTAFLARHVGDKRAREIWFLCRRYSATEAFQMGLVNKVVPADQLDAEVEAWCREILALSPTAIAIAKRSFNADSDNIRGIGALGFEALALYYNSDEAKEGTAAFLEKRRPNFRSRRKERRKPGDARRRGGVKRERAPMTRMTAHLPKFVVRAKAGTHR